MATEDDVDRAARLLRTLQSVSRHDLPNQVVALQSLLQMLEMEQGSQLGDDGREQLRRLNRVAVKIASMARFLRDVVRLNDYTPRREELALARLARDLDVELHQQLPDTTLQHRIEGDVQTVVADARLLTQAFVAIVRFLLERSAPGMWSLRLSARTITAGVELRGDLVRAAGPTRAAQSDLQVERPRLEHSLEVILAEEVLAAGKARLVQIRDDADQSGFTVLVPQPCTHG